MPSLFTRIFNGKLHLILYGMTVGNAMQLSGFLKTHLAGPVVKYLILHKNGLEESSMC